MSTIPRKMPSQKAVLDHWIDRLVLMKKFDSRADACDESGVPNACWKCGFCDRGNLERCHILARCEGGTDDADNLHLLCHGCHKRSEFYSGDRYQEWFSDSNPFTCWMDYPIAGLMLKLTKEMEWKSTPAT